MTVRAGGSGGAAPRAFIVPGGNSSSFSVRYDDEPARTVGDVGRAGNAPRALLVDGQGNTNGENVTGWDGNDPAMVVRAAAAKSAQRAQVPVIVNTREMHDPDSGAAYTARGGDDPIYTIAATSNVSRNKASVGYRIVEMTPRALARFQGFPDWYQLPASKAHTKKTGEKFVTFQDELLTPDSVGKTLACRIIGNAVPPLFSWQLYRHLIDQV